MSYHVLCDRCHAPATHRVSVEIRAETPSGCRPLETHDACPECGVDLLAALGPLMFTGDATEIRWFRLQPTEPAP